MAYLPPIDERLVTALAKQFPDQAAELNWLEKEVYFRAGQVSVVRWLRAMWQEQQQHPIDLEDI